MTVTDSAPVSLCSLDPDADHHPVAAVLAKVGQEKKEVPVHRHRKGQFVLALRGGVTCEVPKAMWIVPPDHAVWIPGRMPHSNRVTENARDMFPVSGARRGPDA